MIARERERERERERDSLFFANSSRQGEYSPSRQDGGDLME